MAALSTDAESLFEASFPPGGELERPKRAWLALVAPNPDRNVPASASHGADIHGCLLGAREGHQANGFDGSPSLGGDPLAAFHDAGVLAVKGGRKQAPESA